MHRCPPSFTHPCDSNKATLDNVRHLMWSLSHWANGMENSKGGSQKWWCSQCCYHSQSTVMEMLECNGSSFIFGCCSTVKTLCGKEIPKQLFAMYMYLPGNRWLSHVFTLCNMEKHTIIPTFSFKSDTQYCLLTNDVIFFTYETVCISSYANARVIQNKRMGMGRRSRVK